MSFKPRWASPPGDTILQASRDRGILEHDLADALDVSPADLHALMEGRVAINLQLARRLADLLGASPQFWLARDYDYRESAARIHAVDKEWTGQFPIGDMVRFGWIQAPRPEEEAAACLQFFGVSSRREWEERYEAYAKVVAFRTSPKLASRPFSVLAWLRRGEVVAEAIGCEVWEPERFLNAVVAARPLTQIKSPGVFLPKLQALCAAAGVAVVVVRAPAGCRASGAVRKMSEHTRVIQLSARFLTDDQFWFSFFHEAGHLLEPKAKTWNVGESDTQVELDGMSDETVEELAANSFAQRIIVPTEFQEEFSRLSADYKEVLRFSVRLGIAPGLIVGQMQHQRRVGYERLNRLKRRYSWA